MNLLRALLASLMSLVCTLTVSAYVTLQTLETTVLDKQEVKTWLHDSNIYDTLFPTLVNTDQTIEQQTDDASSTLVTKDTLQTALNQTFNAGYVQTQTEKVVDSAYNWLKGDSESISFSVNTTEKKQTFIDNLAALIQPKLATLPACASYSEFDSSDPTCLPPGVTAAQAAKLLATDAANSTPFFTQPITDETVEQANKESGTSAAQSPLTSSSSTNANNLPQTIQSIEAWGAWLPLAALLSGGLCIVLSRDRFKASKHLAGRLSVGLALTALAGLLVAYFGKSFSLEGIATGAVATNVIEPVIHQAAPAIGNRLAIVSGSLALVTFAIWLTLTIIKKRRQKAKLLEPPVTPPTPPTAPTQTPPTQTPMQPPR